MANREHLDMIRQGAAAWNEWRSGHLFLLLDLSGAKGNLDLAKANLDGVNLAGADLRGAKLMGAYTFMLPLGLHEADLREADLTTAQIGRCDLTGAGLTAAKLLRAGLDTDDLGFRAAFRPELHRDGEDARWPVAFCHRRF
jgi:uncharacterized protein YjbI with pentapeptide repeats